MSEEKKKYTLYTRSDMDGLVSALLLNELDIIDDIRFAHPKDVQDGKIKEINENCITTNLPYVPGVHMCFDHHASEAEKSDPKNKNHIIEKTAPSAARVVCEHYGGAKSFPRVKEDLLLAADKADTASFDMEDVLNPKDWVLLSFLMDSRTNLGKHKNFRISNLELMISLIYYCVEYDISEILKMKDVKERVEVYREHQLAFQDQIVRIKKKFSRKIIMLDYTKETKFFAGNRFMVYALYPECNISIHKMKVNVKDKEHKDGEKIAFALGKSIFNKSSKLKIGQLMAAYGGGGHDAAGTCQIPVEDSERVLSEIITIIKEVDSGEEVDLNEVINRVKK